MRVYSVIASLQSNLYCHCESILSLRVYSVITSLRSNLYYHCDSILSLRGTKQSLLSLRVYSVIARHEAISLFYLPAMNNRDRHVPRDDRKMRACEAISPFLFCPAMNNRDRHAALAMTEKILSLRGTKQSLFSACQHTTGEIATLRSR